MTFFDVLYKVFIGPLKLFFEIVFEIANEFTGHPGISIIFLSLVMNILVLPLYKRADAMQEQARDIEAKLRDGAAHIKKTFSGDEKMMILQTYYRQNNYKPTDALKGSVSLLLEIPFFMAAYQFLSNLESLEGVSFGPVMDLSRPDELLVIGGMAVNVLPLVMTGINIISSFIYLKGFPMKTKVQLYGMALFFLIFLYQSPSGLVFYWTLNNLFSLVKTICYKVKLIKPDTGQREKSAEAGSNRRLFIIGSICLTILVGILIPSNYIAASPQEFVDITYFHHPLWYIVSSLAMASGTFLVWLRVFYWLARPAGKVFFERLVWILCGLMFTDYMFFGTKLGIISSTLKYENGVSFSGKEQLMNAGILIALAIVLGFVIRKWNKAATAVLLTVTITEGVMSTANLGIIKSSVDQIVLKEEDKDNEGEEEDDDEEDKPGALFELSTKGQNVIVIMLDRGMGAYIPYIMNEKPKLREQFSGFTYYSNVISFGSNTNFGAPALLGGYEYTPVELNRRAEEPLVDKHNEALKVMPVLFADNGYEVTVCDPVYANYQWIPDLSIYDEYPEIDAYLTKGKFNTPEAKQHVIDSTHRNFFCFSLMKTMPLFIQPELYRGGTYYQTAVETDDVYAGQVTEGMSVAQGMEADFMEPYNVLCSLPGMTKVTKKDKNTFLFLENDTTHDPMLLQEPEYVPALNVDNTEYDAANTDRFTVDGKTIQMGNFEQLSHYQANMAALLKLGEWFDYMKEKGVYDNTRIIIASDHGRGLDHFDELTYDDGSDFLKDLGWYYPLLLVKDFNSTGFTVSDEFMTNADVPAIAVDGIIENPVNPFTGNLITSDEKNAHDQYVIISYEWKTSVNNGNTFLPARWARVNDNIWDRDNWDFYEELTVLDEYRFPNESLGE